MIALEIAAVADAVYTAVLIVGFLAFAVWAIWRADRVKAELDELERSVDESVEIPPFRIVDRPPYDWQSEEEPAPPDPSRIGKVG